MATIRLVPSVSAVSNASYATIANAENMYTNTDSTTYGTFTHNRASTSNTYYGYLRGFNFNALPEGAEVTDWTVKIKASATGHTTSTSTSYYMSLVNSTTQIGSTNASGRLSTTTTTFTFADGSLTWDTIVGYGANFGIRIPMRRASSGTADVVSVYGAEIEVTYTPPVKYNITIDNSTSATVVASANQADPGDEVVITTNSLSGITIKDNGTDVTSQFATDHGGTFISYPANDFTTGFSTSDGQFYMSSSSTGTDWLEYAIGYSAEEPYSTSNTNNTYVKNSNNTGTGWINYHFHALEISPLATISAVTVRVYGARENATIDSTHVAKFQCYCGDTPKGTAQEFTSTSNSLVNVTDPGTWTAAELLDAQLRFTLGYYGGRMLGISWYVDCTIPGSSYSYRIVSISTDHTITVTSSGGSDTIYYKNNGSWIAATKVYKKINGVWVQQTDLTNVFDNTINYVKG